jgi:hypothetical protein
VYVNDCLIFAKDQSTIQRGSISQW